MWVWLPFDFGKGMALSLRRTYSRADIFRCGMVAVRSAEWAWPIPYGVMNSYSVWGGWIFLYVMVVGGMGMAHSRRIGSLLDVVG